MVVNVGVGLWVAGLAVVKIIAVGRVAWAWNGGWCPLLVAVVVPVVTVRHVMLHVSCGVVLLVLVPPSVFTDMCSTNDLGIVYGSGLMLYACTDQRFSGPNVNMRKGASIRKLLCGLLRSVRISPSPL